MTHRKPIPINSTLHNQVTEQADEFDLSIKEYSEAALRFFVQKRINPVTYNPAAEFDLVQLTKKSTDKIISFIKFQEQTIFQRIVEEVVKSRLLQEAELNLLIERLIDDPASRDKVTEDILKHISSVEKKLKNDNKHQENEVKNS